MQMQTPSPPAVPTVVANTQTSYGNHDWSDGGDTHDGGDNGLGDITGTRGRGWISPQAIDKIQENR
jgi:hypothetical protein